MADHTITVGPGKTYASLNAALTNYGYKNLTTDNGSGGPGILTIECYSMEDTTPADTGTGWTTSSSYYLHIKAAENHGGKWSTSSYRLKKTGGAGDLLIVRAGKVKVTGLQLDFPTAGNWSFVSAIDMNTSVPDGADYTYEKLIIRGSMSGTDTYLWAFRVGSYSGSRTCRIINCVVYDWINGSQNSIRAIGLSAGWTTYVYNSTFHNCYTAVYNGAGDNYGYNLGMAGCTDPVGVNSGSFTQTTCSTSHPTFADSNHGTTGDFHLASGDTTWKDAGDGTTPKSVFTDDIDGETRPATDGDWDIGADEYVAAGGGSNPVAWSVLSIIPGRS